MSDLAWEFIRLHEKELKGLVKRSCRGRFDLCDDIWCDVIVARTEQCMSTWDEALGSSLKQHVFRALKWYVFKWLNKQLHLRYVEGQLAARHSPLYDETACSFTPFVDFERSDEVQYILSQLDEYDRSLLELYHLGGLTFEAIGDILNVSKGTARNHYILALEKARDIAQR